MSRPEPEVSVVVCHHKGDFIQKFVQSVKKSVGISYEIIVVTSDPQLAITGIPHCWVHYHEGMPAAKRNAGVRMALSEFIAFFDDDVEIEKDCLVQLRNELNTPNIGMVYGKLLKADEPHRFDEAGGYLTQTGFIWSRAGQNIEDRGQYDYIEPIFAGKSASCMVQKHAFNTAGGFDEDFEILGEESDLSWRLWLCGFGIIFNPYARGIHYFNTKWKPAAEYYTSKRVHFNGPRNYLTMLFKNLEMLNLCKILPIHLIIWLGASFVMLITGKFIQSKNIFLGVLAFIINLPTNIRKRKWTQEKRECSDADIWPSIYRRTSRKYYLERFGRYIGGNLHG